MTAVSRGYRHLTPTFLNIRSAFSHPVCASRRPPELCYVFIHVFSSSRRRDGEMESSPLLSEHISDGKYVHNGRVKDICHAQKR